MEAQTGVAVAQRRVIDAPAQNVERQNAQRGAAKLVQSAIQVCRAIRAGLSMYLSSAGVVAWL
eukprot:589098-Pleurochrysis_carterae.AAC.1